MNHSNLNHYYFYPRHPSYSQTLNADICSGGKEEPGKSGVESSGVAGEKVRTILFCFKQAVVQFAEITAVVFTIQVKISIIQKNFYIFINNSMTFFMYVE